jgi:hypothetical protein
MRIGVFYVVLAEMLKPGQLFESQTVKRRIKGWCEMAASLEIKTVGTVSRLWDIRQPVRTLPKDIVRIRYQETTIEDRKLYVCCVNQ